jgi:hypothetical protein
MTLEEIEKAIAQLSPDDLARFRAWFEQFDAFRFDEKTEADPAAGKQDGVADAVLLTIAQD